MSVLLIVYGILLFGGGFMGYAKAKSQASLISGVVTGLVGIVAGVLVKSNPTIGLGIGAALAVVVTIIFAMRYQKTRKPMLAMPLIVISILVAIASIVSLTHKA